MSREESVRPPGPSKAPAAKPLPPFGKFRLLRELGRGGMGVVYEAIESGLERKVALKTMIVSPFADPKAAEMDEERFLREAQLCARLPKHPHIVGVYEAGVIDGRRYLSMELIEGKPMGAWRDDSRITLRQEIEVIRDVALAVHHAHEQGVIHRDLKPANILIDAKNGPHITDFGLAKMVGENLSLSLTGAGMAVGTPAYMSPEQAQGLKTTDRRTDVYALGVMLFETLTGHPPFEGATAVELLMKASKNPVPSASGQMKVRLAPAQAKGLDAICHKALAKRPEERYRDAAALAADLGRWLKGEEIRIVLQTTRRLARTPKRNWAGLAVGGVLLAILAITMAKGPSGPDPDVERRAAEAKERADRLAAENQKLKAAERELEAMNTRLIRAADVRAPGSLKPGLIGEYFGGVNFDMPSLRRIDPEIRFSIKAGQSWPGGPTDMMSMRWRGYLRIPETGTYVFQAWCADGLRIFIDNTDIITNWFPRKITQDTGTGILEKGYHQFVLESFCSTSFGGVHFFFKKSNDSGEAKTGIVEFFHDPAGFTPLSQSPTREHLDRESVPGAQEAESLPVLEAAPGSWGAIPFGRKGGMIIWGKKSKVGDRLKVGFDSPKAGERTLILALSRVKNAGTFKISVNGTVVTEKLDLFTPGNYTLEFEFKKVPLRNGQNELEFTLVGSNPAAVEWSRGDGIMKLGFDYLRLR